MATAGDTNRYRDLTRYDTSECAGERNPPLLQDVSEDKWAEMESWSQEKQRQFLERWESKFQKEPVNSQTRNVKRGDHLYRPGSLYGKKYNHHFLCTDVSDNNIEVIEYTGPNVEFSASSESSASKNPLAFANIKTSTLSYDLLVYEKAMIIKWPKELERFTVEETIERAKTRIKERLYHALDNNCEHFVTWCKCGLNTSLQVKPCLRTAWEWTSATAKYGLQIAAKAISKKLSLIEDGVGAAIETGLALYSIQKDYKKMKGKIIKEKEFRENTVKTSFKAAGRVVGGIFGSIYGPAGSFAGGLVGMVVGSVDAAVVNEAAPKIATVVKNAASTFYKSLFS